MSKNDSKASGNGSAGKESSGMQAFLKEWLPYVLLLLAVVLIRIFILINASVPTESMDPTIPHPARVMGLKTSYWFSEPERGDIIVFWAPDLEKTRYVKRIIAKGGDTLEIVEGKVFLNGTELDEPYLREEMRVENYGPVTVPEGSYFCMGDNRNHSLDARYWENTWVTKDIIIGKVYFLYWPLNKISWLAGTAGDTFAAFE